MKKITALVLILALSLCLFAGCGKTETQPTQAPATESTAPATEVPETVSQGVSDTEILVGNTAATTGAFATVGVPFNAGLEAAFLAQLDQHLLLAELVLLLQPHAPVDRGAAVAAAGIEQEQRLGDHDAGQRRAGIDDVDGAHGAWP